MNSLFEQLPPELLQALNRWYLFSVLALCITLLGISYIHVSASLKLTNTSPNTEVAQPTKSLPEQEAALKASENELKKLIAQHELFFKLFGAILSSVPQQIQLTFFTIEPEKISCKGFAYSMDDITKFMRTLQDKIHLSITEFDLQQPSPSLLSFTLSARVESVL